MKVRYGILVQVAQFLAQAYLDWCKALGRFNEPFNFMVPRDVLDGLPEEYDGVLVTISPAKDPDTRMFLTELSVVQAVRSTIGNKHYKPLKFKTRKK